MNNDSEIRDNVTRFLGMLIIVVVGTATSLSTALAMFSIDHNMFSYISGLALGIALTVYLSFLFAHSYSSRQLLKDYEIKLEEKQRDL